MFDENFTFDTPRSPSLDSSNTASTRDHSRSVSPCSAVGPYPPARFSVTDLAAQFAGQRIQRSAQMCYDSCDAYANNDDDEAGWQIAPEADLQRTSSRTLPQQRPHSPTSARQARQVNARLLCSTSHHRDIADLVARMVDSSEQCSVTASDFSASTTADDNADEGYDSHDEATRTQPRRSSLAVTRRLEYRRSSEIKPTGSCVNKSARFRRDKTHMRKRSAEE